MNVVYLTSDLLFSSRVSSLGRSAGVRVVVVGTRASLVEQVAANQAAMVLLDLEHREADAALIVPELARLTPRPQVVAYGPHVKESLLLNAQTAACDVVLSRGQFDKQVAALFQSLSAQGPRDNS